MPTPIGLPLLLNFILVHGQCAWSRLHVLQQGAYGARSVEQEKPLVIQLNPVVASVPSHCSENSWLWPEEPPQGCAQRKRHKSFIFHCQLQGKKRFFSIICMTNFFQILCTHGYKLKHTGVQRNGAKTQAHLSYRSTTLCPSWGCQHHPSPVSPGGNLHRLVNGSSLKHTRNI